VNSKLDAFLERAEAVLARLEPLLPAQRESIEWDQCLAAAGSVKAARAICMPLDVSLEMRLRT
jgi:uncharacterized protein